MSALCDKCSKPCRPHNNILYLLWAAGEFRHSLGVLFCANRHLLPDGDCAGSPSRAQYLAGQPRDARYPYVAEIETRYRAAYQHILSVDEDQLANGTPSEWLPRSVL